MLYIVMEGDLHTLSRSNIMFKYADDTNLLVPAYSDVSLLSEFEHVKQWAADNKMIINISKTKELVFQRKYPVQSYWELSLRIILVLMNM